MTDADRPLRGLSLPIEPFAIGMLAVATGIMYRLIRATDGYMALLG